MSINPVFATRSRLANAYRGGSGATPEQFVGLRQDLTAAKLERAIAAAIAEAPSLRPEQRDQLALLLLGQP